MKRVSQGSEEPFEASSIRPYVVFYSHVTGTKVHFLPVPIVNGITKTNFDLAAFRLHAHAAFVNNFPTLPIADYDEIHEAMEIGTCGFPLGNFLQE